MATVTLRCFLFLIVVCCVLISSNLNATTVDFSSHSSIVKTSSGLFFRKTATGTTALSGPGDIFNIDNQFKVPTKNGLVPVSVARTAPVDLPRVGSAVAKFAKKAGPIGMSIAAAELICDLSSICDDGSGNWEVLGDPQYEGFPASVSSTGSSWSGWNGVTFPSAQTSCSDCARLEATVGPCNDWTYDSHVLLSGVTYQCKARRISDGVVFSASNTTQGDGCPDGYSLDGSTCTLDDQPHPPSEQEWTDVESLLNDYDFTEPLFNAGEDVPVQLPAGIPPINTITATSTETLKDGNGNVTGTKVTERSVTLTDASTIDEPNKYDVTETEKVTTYDQNNVKTSETETTSEAEPTTENEEPVTFDDVSDVALEEKEVSAILDITSWGGGSCPAPIAMDTTFGSYQFDTQPFCDYAEALKPFILIVASIIAGLIILRSRQT